MWLGSSGEAPSVPALRPARSAGGSAGGLAGKLRTHQDGNLCGAAGPQTPKPYHHPCIDTGPLLTGRES